MHFMKWMNREIRVFIFFFIFFSSSIFAQEKPLEGLWKTYDNDGNARSVIQFFQAGDKVHGKIVKILHVSGKDEETCTHCKGEHKDKPLAGMVVVWGLERDGDKWVNGRVLDVDSGKTYNCSITLSERGDIMHFYAYLIGPFGAKIKWERVK
jgi:uncharacterized protein (DUF2147 family)